MSDFKVGEPVMVNYNGKYVAGLINNIKIEQAGYGTGNVNTVYEVRLADDGEMITVLEDSLKKKATYVSPKKSPVPPAPASVPAPATAPKTDDAKYNELKRKYDALLQQYNDLKNKMSQIKSQTSDKLKAVTSKAQGILSKWGMGGRKSRRRHRTMKKSRRSRRARHHRRRNK